MNSDASRVRINIYQQVSLGLTTGFLAYMILLYTGLSWLNLIAYSLCTAFIYLIYANNIVIIRKSTSVEEEKVVGMSNIASSLGSILSPHIIFFSMASLNRLWATMIVASFLAVQLVLLNYLKRNSK